MAGRRMGGGPRNPPPFLIAANHHQEVQAILHDRQKLVAIHSGLKKDLSAADHELRKLAAAAHEVREERESQIKELYEKSLNLESEIRSIEALNSEHAQVIGDIQKLTESKIQLAAQFKVLDAELSRVKEDASQLPVIQADVENMKQELQKGRAAVEFERKTQLANRELSQAMGSKITSMQLEIEMLRAELSDAEKRARAAAAASNPNPGYMAHYGSRSMTYGGGPYSVQYSMHQGQLTADGPSPALYGRSSGSHGPYDVQQPRLP